MDNIIEVRIVRKGELMGKVVNSYEYNSPEEKRDRGLEAISCCENWFQKALPGSQKRYDFIVISKDNSTLFYKLPNEDSETHD